MSIGCDIQLFDGKSTRHPNANQLIDRICQRLDQAIQIYDKTTLSKATNHFYFILFIIFF